MPPNPPETTNPPDAGAPATEPESTEEPEIEITPAMIDAGVDALNLDRGLEIMQAEDLVCSIFRAMVLASPRS